MWWWILNNIIICKECHKPCGLTLITTTTKRVQYKALRKNKEGSPAQEAKESSTVGVVYKKQATMLKKSGTKKHHHKQGSQHQGQIFGQAQNFLAGAYCQPRKVMCVLDHQEAKTEKRKRLRVLNHCQAKKSTKLYWWKKNPNLQKKANLLEKH